MRRNLLLDELADAAIEYAKGQGSTHAARERVLDAALTFGRDAIAGDCRAVNKSRPHAHCTLKAGHEHLRRHEWGPKPSECSHGYGRNRAGDCTGCGARVT